jgi:hypothetical protein
VKESEEEVKYQIKAELEWLQDTAVAADPFFD